MQRLQSQRLETEAGGSGGQSRVHDTLSDTLSQETKQNSEAEQLLKGVGVKFHWQSVSTHGTLGRGGWSSTGRVSVSTHETLGFESQHSITQAW